MTSKRNSQTGILDQLRDLVHKLLDDPTTYEDAQDNLSLLIAENDVEMGFDAGREYAATLLARLVVALRKPGTEQNLEQGRSL